MNGAEWPAGAKARGGVGFNLPPPPRNSLPGGTHPNNDAVVPLKNGDEFVPPQNLGLVQGPKSAEHLDATFVVGLRHGGRRRGVGALLERQGWCVPRKRELTGGRSKGQVLGLWGRPGEGWGAELDALLSCGSGMRENWTSGPQPAICLSTPSAAAPRCGPGRGGDQRAGRGFLCWGSGASRPPIEWWHVSCFFSPPLTLEDNLALTLSPLKSLPASHPDILDLSVSLSDATPLEEIGVCGRPVACLRKRIYSTSTPFTPGHPLPLSQSSRQIRSTLLIPLPHIPHTESQPAHPSEGAPCTSMEVAV